MRDEIRETSEEERAVERDVFGREFELKGEILQEDVEKYTRAFMEFKPLGAGEMRGAELKAAIRAGWIVKPACAALEEYDLGTGKRTVRYVFDGVEVGKLRAREVIHYARLVTARYVEETEVPDPKG